MSRRQSSGLSAFAAAIGGAVTIVLAGCAGLGLIGWRTWGPKSEVSALTTAGPSVVAPSPTVEGESWAVNELLEYLFTHGVRLKDMGMPRLNGDKDMGSIFGNVDDDRDLVSVMRCESPTAARNQRAHADDVVWGRFVISSNPEMLARIRKALGV